MRARPLRPHRVHVTLCVVTVCVMAGVAWAAGQPLRGAARMQTRDRPPRREHDPGGPALLRGVDVHLYAECPEGGCTADARASLRLPAVVQERTRRGHTSCGVSRHRTSPREPASLPTGVKDVVCLSSMIGGPHSPTPSVLRTYVRRTNGGQKRYASLPLLMKHWWL